MPSFVTPADRTASTFVPWVALVTVFSVLATAFRCDMLGFDADLSLHGLQNSCLHPSRSVTFGRFLRQEVQIIGCLGGQAYCDDGFSTRHGSDEVEDNNKHF